MFSSFFIQIIYIDLKEFYYKEHQLKVLFYVSSIVLFLDKKYTNSTSVALTINVLSFCRATTW